MFLPISADGAADTRTDLLITRSILSCPFAALFETIFPSFKYFFVLAATRCFCCCCCCCCCISFFPESSHSFQRLDFHFQSVPLFSPPLSLIQSDSRVSGLHSQLTNSLKKMSSPVQTVFPVAGFMHACIRYGEIEIEKKECWHWQYTCAPVRSAGYSTLLSPPSCPTDCV